LNQAILFNDDLSFNIKEDAWCVTAQVSGQKVTIYFHSKALNKLSIIDNCTQYDLEEFAELWLEKNEVDGDSINISI